MDTSETYIKMCEKAEEIQGKHRYGESDFIALFQRNKEIRSLREWHVYSYCDGYRPDGEPQVWLPRQDQLQEMLGGFANASNLLIDFIEDVQPHGSFEKFWLSLVMQEKYNKTWDGEEWH